MAYNTVKVALQKQMVGRAWSKSFGKCWMPTNCWVFTRVRMRAKCLKTIQFLKVSGCLEHDLSLVCSALQSDFSCLKMT